MASYGTDRLAYWQLELAYWKVRVDQEAGRGPSTYDATAHREAQRLEAGALRNVEFYERSIAAPKGA